MFQTYRKVLCLFQIAICQKKNKAGDPLSHPLAPTPTPQPPTKSEPPLFKLLGRLGMQTLDVDVLHTLCELLRSFAFWVSGVAFSPIPVVKATKIIAESESPARFPISGR